jgi:hypothetical protein
MIFEKAEIKIDRQTQFEELQSAIDRAFAADKVEKFLNRTQRNHVRIRNLEAVLAKGILEYANGVKPGVTCQALYDALTVSDQAQMREFYLAKIEQLDPGLRTKFKKLYQYY